MRGRQLFLMALGVGLAVAVAPMAVDAAKRTFSFDKNGRAKVVVLNTPKVKVPGGVKVTNQPVVSVGNRPEVTVAGEPTVKVSNQPSRMTALPPVERNFNLTLEGLEDVSGRPLVELGGGERAAITEVTIVVNGEATSPSRARLYTRQRTSGTNPCGSGGGWESPMTLRTYALRAGETLQLDYSGAPLVVGGDGQTCLGFQQQQWWGGTKMDVGVSGFYFSAG